MNNPENGNKTFDNYLNFTCTANPLYLSNKHVVKKDDRNRARKSYENRATKPPNKEVIRAN